MKCVFHLAWLWEPQTQQHKEAFLFFLGTRNDEECRVAAAALQTPDTTVEYSARDPHSYPAPVFINSRSCIKAQGLSLQTPTHPPSALKTRLRFNYLCSSGMWRDVGQKRHKMTFKSRCWPKEQPSLPLGLWKHLLWSERRRSPWLSKAPLICGHSSLLKSHSLPPLP